MSTPRRYEITDFEWSAIQPLLPNKPRGVPRADNPLMQSCSRRRPTTRRAVGAGKARATTASRQGEDDVVVRHWQQVGLPLLQPGPRPLALALGAVPIAAGVVGDGGVVAALAAQEHGRRAPPSGRLGSLPSS